MFPLFALQAKMAQCATEIMVSGASAALAVAGASMDAAAKAVPGGEGKSKSRSKARSDLPATTANGSGFPMFDPFKFSAPQWQPKTSLPFFPFTWPAAASPWPTAAAPPWSQSLWFQLPASPFAAFANPFQRRRSAMEQMFDPLGLWRDDEFTTPYPFAMSAPPAAVKEALRPAMESIKNVQAATIALMAPYFMKSTGLFPAP